MTILPILFVALVLLVGGGLLLIVGGGRRAVPEELGDGAPAGAAVLITEARDEESDFAEDEIQTRLDELPAEEIWIVAPEPDLPLYDAEDLARPLRTRLLAPLVHDVICGLGTAAQGQSRLLRLGGLRPDASQVEAWLEEAGRPHAWTATEYLGIQEICSIGGGLASLPILWSVAPGPLALFSAAIVGTVVGLGLPRLYLAYRGTH